MEHVKHNVPEDRPVFWTKTSWLQLGYGVWVNMTVLGIGLAFGFPAITVPQLRQSESGIKVTMSDEAWIVSILTLSSPIGSVLCGILMDKYGRKIVLVLCEIPMFIGWIYMGSAATARDIIIGRVISGVGIGMAMTAPRAYITEITLPNMRGVLGALPNLALSIGLSIQAGLGSFLNWHTLCYICGAYTLILFIANLFLPDTPYFLILKSSPSITRLNLRRFRSSNFDIDTEIDELFDFKETNSIRRLTWKEQIHALFKTSSCKPYGITTTYISIMQLSGVNVVIMYAVEILQTAKSSMDSNLGNFILALTRIVIGVVTSILIFKLKRRAMALISAIGVGVAALGLCGLLYTLKEKSVLPQFMFMGYVAFATLGYYTLPLTMMFEMLPLQMRGILSGICISQLNLMMFAINNAYPYIQQKYGLANTMAFFGTFSLIGALVLFFFLPETKDLTLQEIEEYFNNIRPTLVSQRTVMSMQLAEASKTSTAQSKSNIQKKTSGERKRRDLLEIMRSKSVKNLTEENKNTHTEDKDLKIRGQKGV